MGVGVASTGLNAVSVLVTNWFAERRGLAMGIALFGKRPGRARLQPARRRVLALYGWQATYLFFAARSLCWPYRRLLYWHRPRDRGLLPLGSNGTTGARCRWRKRGFRPRVALHRVLLAAGAHGIFSSVEVMGVQMHLVPYLCDIGHDSAFASLVMGLTLGSARSGQVVVGVISDGSASPGACPGLRLSVAASRCFRRGSSAVAVTGALLFSFGITSRPCFRPSDGALGGTQAFRCGLRRGESFHDDGKRHRDAALGVYLRRVSELPSGLQAVHRARGCYRRSSACSPCAGALRRDAEGEV